jgi:hypothetical protein
VRDRKTQKLTRKDTAGDLHMTARLRSSKLRERRERERERERGGV